MLRYGGMIFVVAALACMSSACAPERAEAIREDKSLTLGLPGASYRPTGKLGVGVTGSYGHREKMTVNTKERGVTALAVNFDTNRPSTLEGDKEIDASHTTINPFVQYFPWSTSAFFVGVGGSFYHATYRFEEETEGSTNLAPSYTGVSYDINSTYIGVPAGWAWIWESGFSLGLDFGPRFRVNRDIAYRNDGASSGVNRGKRDETVATIDSLERPVNWGGTGIIGWSF